MFLEAASIALTLAMRSCRRRHRGLYELITMQEDSLVVQEFMKTWVGGA